MKTIFIAHCVVRAVAFICVTVAAMYFQKVSVLWWYIAPLLMELSCKTKEIEVDT